MHAGAVSAWAGTVVGSRPVTVMPTDENETDHAATAVVRPTNARRRQARKLSYSSEPIRPKPIRAARVLAAKSASGIDPVLPP